MVAALAVLGAAWAHGPTRQKVRESIEIDAPQAKVWAVIGNFQDMSWLAGVSKTEGLATLVRSGQQLQDKSALGFQQAATNMVANLETELTAFQKRLKEQPATARVIRSPGYTGAGAWDWAHVSLFGGVVVLGMFWQRRKA